jgi:DNA-binding LytR/AlgR family response regulator
MPLKCLIIDDEPLARNGLKEYVAEVEGLELMGEFEHPLRAMDILAAGTIDLIFLDIQMPKITGIDFMKSLQQKPMVIFTTAYPQYAVEGFDLDAVDYLLKPFSFDRFLKSVMKAKRLSDKMKSPDPVAETGDDHIFIKADQQLVKIYYADIIYAEALQNYVAIQTSQKKYIAYLTFKSLVEALPPKLFIQTHKSYLVSINKVGRVEEGEAIIDKYRIPISRNLKEDVLSKLMGDKFLRR